MISQFLYNDSWPTWLRHSIWFGVIFLALNTVIYYNFEAPTRDRIDAAFDRLHDSLKALRINLVGRVAGTSEAVLQGVYGSTSGSRVARALVLAIFYVVATYGVAIVLYDPLSPEVIHQLARIEDDIASKIVGDRAGINRAFEEFRGYYSSGYANNEERDIKLREDVFAARRVIQDRILSEDGNTRLSMLYLLTGSRLYPDSETALKRSLGNLTLTVLWNALIDILSISITLRILAYAIASPHTLKSLKSIVFLIMYSCAVISLFILVLCSYKPVNYGILSSVYVTVIVVPLAISFGITTFGVALSLCFEKPLRYGYCVLAVFIILFFSAPLIVGTVYSCYSSIMGITIPDNAFRECFYAWGIPNLWIGEDLNFIPYVLAFTAIIPAIIVVCVMWSTIFSSIITEAVRTIVVRYLTVVKNMPQRTFLLVTATPLALCELISFLAYGP